MSESPPRPPGNPSWSRTVVRALLICGGCVAILLPAWLPSQPSGPLKSGVVDMLQGFLLAGAAVLMLGTSPHAGVYRPACRVLALAFIAAFVGEIEDFISGLFHWEFPLWWVVGPILLVALVTALRHRRLMGNFIAMLGNHAGAGLIASALLINYVFSRVIGSMRFWKAALGQDAPPAVPQLCRGYLELLACYFIFIGALGLSLTLARRPEPS